jgi:hypothetical protein
MLNLGVQTPFSVELAPLRITLPAAFLGAGSKTSVFSGLGCACANVPQLKASIEKIPVKVAEHFKVLVSTIKPHLL